MRKKLLQAAAKIRQTRQDLRAAEEAATKNEAQQRAIFQLCDLLDEADALAQRIAFTF